MKFLIFTLCVVIALACDPALAAPWLPSSGHTQIPIWPDAPPDSKPMPGPEHLYRSDGLVGGRHYWAVENISQPTLTVYPAKRRNAGAAVVVLPGGGFQELAIDLEGTEVCDWLTAKGVTCILLKYRVPSEPYDWQCNCRPDNLMTSTRSLEDAQRAFGLVRLHAKEWRIDPHKIGVLGFSAGGYLAAEISTNYQHRLYAPIDDADKESARPDFAVLIYPGHLVTKTGSLNPNTPVSSETPPTFLLQAGDDKVDSVQNTLLYYAALRKAGVPAEMHFYAQGGHAFGLRRTSLPITDWPRLVDTWLHTIGVTSP